jgi:hypothetical protein
MWGNIVVLACTVTAWGCSFEQDVLSTAFRGCEGFERPYTEALFACMDKMGTDQDEALERCALFARILVCHGTPKLPPCKCEQEKAAAQRWKDRVDALRGCYNWTDFVDDCDGFSTSSVMLCEGRTGPGDVCTEDSWRAYQLEQKYGRMVTDGPLPGAPVGPCEKLRRMP